jgi:hypothetical protein
VKVQDRIEIPVKLSNVMKAIVLIPTVALIREIVMMPLDAAQQAQTHLDLQLG